MRKKKEGISDKIKIELRKEEEDDLGEEEIEVQLNRLKKRNAGENYGMMHRFTAAKKREEN